MARRLCSLLLLLVLCGGAVALGAPAKKSAPPDEDYYELFKLLVDMMDQVERNYVKDVDRREMFEAAVEGVMGTLDPYSSYIKPKEISRFRSTVDSHFGGIGIRVSVDHEKLTILSPVVGTPGYRAGLLSGDRIVEIDGESTEELSIDDAVRRLKGKPGSKVTLTVVHPGTTKRVKIEVVREIIHVSTVLGDTRKEDDTWEFMLKPQQHIGYVRITGFSRDTARETREVLDGLQKEKLRGLIIDLRFNPGGLLSSAIEVSDLFVSQGTIVSTEGRNSPKREWTAEKKGTYEGFPMVVLVNRYSASASEIVSACLQDHDRAVILGERTWGKGSVQNVIELEDGASALKLTTASYRRPSGKNIHRFHGSKEEDEWGVMPDDGFLVELGDAEMRGLIDDRRQRDVIQQHTDADDPDGDPDDDPDDDESKNGGDGAKPHEGASEEPADGGESEEPALLDRQLQKAVEYLVGELARAE